MSERLVLKSLVSVLGTSPSVFALAPTTPIKFQLDWRFEGPSALFLTPAAKGYFKDSSLTSASMSAMAPVAP
jgi:NitT/TauT family transport system substrate-binding protein